MSILAERPLPEELKAVEVTEAEGPRAVTRTEWELGTAAIHGIAMNSLTAVVREPIFSSQDPRSHTGSWGPFTQEFGLPDTPRPMEEEVKTLKTQELVAEMLPKLQAGFTKGVKYGMKIGFIPSYVGKRLPNLFTKAPTRVFSTTPQIKEDAVKAFYDEYDNTFNVAGNLSREYIRTRLPHEWQHQIEGGAFIEKEGAFANLRRIRVGFGLAKQEEGDYTNRYLTDTITEHKTAAIMDGDFETIDPDLRAGDNRSYRNMRKMFGVFIDKSGGIVQLKTVCRASFEDNVGPDATYVDRKAMIRQFTTAYAPSEYKGKLYSVKNSINRLLGALEDDTTVTRKLFDALADCIVPPELDEQGNVLKKGWIDRTRLEELIADQKQASNPNSL